MSKIIRLESDYTDYYDSIFSDEGKSTYRRISTECMPRGRAIKYLKELGVPTIEVGQVNTFNSLQYSKLVVYTNSRQHGGKGKVVVSTDEAKRYYSNYLAAPYIENTNGASLKYIQIGGIAIQLSLRNNGDKAEIKSGEVVESNRSDIGMNKQINIPIFSIDYIPVNGIITAIDFNSSENLSRYGIDKIVTPDEILAELSKII